MGQIGRPQRGNAVAQGQVDVDGERRLGEEGKVVLRLFVESNGRAAQVEIRTASGSTRLDQAAADAVAQWKFVPARRGEESVGAWVLVPIIFSLKG